MLITPLISLFVILTSSPAAAGPRPPANMPDAGSVLRILPNPGDMARHGDIALYPASRLAEYIDGAAETYREYGVIETSTVSFGPPTAKLPRITIDLHRMYEPKNAFGIFRVERSDKAEDLKLGGEAAWQSGLLTFWQGPYYARLVSEASRDTTIACARALSDLLPADGDTLIQMGFFPRAAISGSERWVPRSYLGIKGLDDVWTATCRDTAGTFDVFFRRNRPPLRQADVGKVGKILTQVTVEKPIQLIQLEKGEKGRVLILFYKKMARYTAGYLGPKPNADRTAFMSKWIDQLPTGR